MARSLDTYSAIVILFAFVSILSLAIGNYVTSRVTIDLYRDGSSNSEEVLEESGSMSEVHVRKGDTLGKIFATQNIVREDRAEILKELKKQKIDITLKPGQVISFDYAVSEEDNSENFNNVSLKEITIELSKTRNVVITSSQGKFIVKDILTELKRKFVSNTVKVNSGFMAALMKIGISASNIQELVSVYSHQVDFQRQIKSGDTISVITEKFYTEDGDFAHNGKIIYSSLNISGKNYEIYWFKDPATGAHQYFSESGKSAKRSLLRTPINVARISSGFGRRADPVLGFTKMHKGVDFSAPTGTPIFAAGDGVVKEMGYMGAYGNIVKIKHSPSLTTAYAHASKFASNLRPGSKVKQGQVIAYVGRTGRATGPHCHFEVIINGKHVNPMSVQSTPGIELKKDSLKSFEKHKKMVSDYLRSIQPGKPVELANL